MSKELTRQYASDHVGRDPAYGKWLGYSTTVPADASAGYAPGCLFIDIDGAAGAQLFVNEGTATSCDFNAIQSTGAAANLTFGPKATPTAVATSPGTAVGTQLTVTGGVGGNSTLATTAVGGVGGGLSFTGGAGGVATAGATASTGGAGGAWSVTTGAGGAEAVATVTATGGAGGAYGVTTGAGGAVSAAVSGTATGGASGALTLTSGTGGAVTATTGTNVGGASGAVTLSSGVGGAASGATDTGGAGGTVAITGGTGGAGDTGGAGAAVTITAGDGGTGSGTGGAGGVLTLATGAVGSGGSPTKGKLLIKMAGTEKFGCYGDGTTAVFTTLGAIPTNVNIDGVFIPKGGVALTDVRNALIDDASGGSGTVAHFIGNQQITTSSDVRVKRNVVPFEQSALDALAKAPPLVSFHYALPQDESEYGPNSRGRYLGFIAQETVDVFPWAVNAGNAKDCGRCRAGLACEAHADHTWTVEYQHLVPLLIRAVNELRAEVKALTAGK